MSWVALSRPYGTTRWPNANPGLPRISCTLLWTRPRMRLSLRKAARGSVTPTSYTGNPGPSWATLSRPFGTDHDKLGELICFQRVRYKSGHQKKLIWTRLTLSRPSGT
jgi:hypothetical protein